MRQKPNSTLRTRLALSVAFGLGGAYLSMTAWSAPATPGAEAATYLNPVIDSSFPDPSLLRDRGVYYAYATNHSGDPHYKGDELHKSDTLPCARSVDLVHWTLLTDAMPTLPAWVIPGHTWAPQVTAFVPGRRYVAYFTAHDKGSDSQEIGVAVAPRPPGRLSSWAMGR